MQEVFQLWDKKLFHLLDPKKSSFINKNKISYVKKKLLELLSYDSLEKKDKVYAFLYNLLNKNKKPYSIFNKTNWNSYNYIFIKILLKNNDFQEYLFNRLILNQVFRRKLFAQIKEYDFVGFSLSNDNQFSLLEKIAELIKKKFPNKKIIAGGQAITHLFESEKQEIGFKNIDYFSVSEGEICVYTLINLKGDIKNVPNLVYYNHEKLIKNKLGFLEDLNDLPIPDYNLYLSKYKLSNRMQYLIGIDTKYLYYEPARGCAWNKCTHCFFNKNVYREKKIFKIVIDLNKIKEQTGVDYFFFVTDEITPIFASKLAAEIINRKLDIKWSCFMRLSRHLDYGLLKLLKESGCERIVFGLESGNQEINNQIKKV